MSDRTRLLLAIAIVFGAVLVGGMADRVIVAAPAWRQLGTDAWANYSRHADLGTGLIAYPVEAIGAALFTLSAVLSHRLDRRGARQQIATLYLSAGGYIAGLLLTLKAAPIMLGLGNSGAAPTAAFGEFHFWGLYLRGSVDAVALIAGIWTLGRSEGR